MMLRWPTPLLVLILSSCSPYEITEPDVSIKLGGQSYRVKTSYSVIREISQENKIRFGDRFVTTFLYSGKSAFIDNNNCGLIGPSDIDVDFSPGKAFENALSSKEVFALCFSDNKTYDFYSSGCDHSRVYGGTCYIRVAGYYDSKRIMNMNYGLIDSRLAFVIIPEKIEVLEKDSLQGLKAGVEAGIEIADMYGKLKDVGSFVK
jgi:hypothetical protein